MYYQIQNSKLLQSAHLVNFGVLYGSWKNSDYFSIQRFTAEPECVDCTVRAKFVCIIQVTLLRYIFFLCKGRKI
jgi:hypothetical protein